MRKACLVVDNFYLNNRIFDLSDKISNRDNCLFFFNVLRAEFLKSNIDLSTQDINKVNDSEIVIYNEMPRELPLINDIPKSYLLLFETDLINKSNWDLNKHKYFNKIFTWNDDFIDNKKYFKFNFSHKFPNEIINKPFESKKLCTLIAGHKNNCDKRELYSKRLEIIKWLDKKHSADFDFYGMGWDKFMFKYPFSRLNNYSFLLELRKKLARKYISYKGSVESKFDTLSSYKFCICYENAKDIPGYITEKIFDCFFSGCVPIYWGAPNITDYIPSNCFIDKRKFKNSNDLFNHIKNISENEYKEIIFFIKDFIKSSAADFFNAKIISKELVSKIYE